MVQLDELKREVKTRRRTDAVLTAVVVAVVVVGASWLAASHLGGSDDSIAPPAQTRAPTPRAVQPQSGALESGRRYAIPIHGVTDFHTEVTVPGPGWSYPDYIGLSRDNPSTGLLFWHVGRVYSDPCALTSSALPDGHSPEDLMAALDAQKGTRLSAPTDTTVGGHTAVRVDLIKAPRYSGGDACKLWEDPAGSFRPGPDESPMPLWIVDVDGTTVVIDLHTDQLDPEIEKVVDSVTFTNP